MVAAGTRQRRRGGAARQRLGVALVASLAWHACALVWLLGRSSDRLEARAALAAAPSGPPEAAVDPQVVDLTSEAEALPASEPSLAAAHEADEARRGELAPPRAGSPDDRTPAPDRGSSAGRAVREAWRRDRSTLRTRVSDGATVYQIARDQTSAQASSPQPVRQVPRPGRGDAPATERVATARPQPPVELARAGSSDGARDVDPSVADVQGADDANGHRRAVGGLDAPPGPRRYDTPDLGPARERVDERQASNEPRPGLMELTAVATPGPRDGVTGRGSSSSPGATKERTSGTAPVRAGAPDGTGIAAADAAAAERAYARQLQEISRRVGQVTVFPQRLKLALEQGESIVRFVVRPDGRLGSTVELVKSAGFPEFDAEAVSAVKRAAPFPPIGAQRLVELRIPFQNPVVK